VHRLIHRGPPALSPICRSSSRRLSVVPPVLCVFMLRFPLRSLGASDRVLVRAPRVMMVRILPPGCAGQRQAAAIGAHPASSSVPIRTRRSPLRVKSNRRTEAGQCASAHRPDPRRQYLQSLGGDFGYDVSVNRGGLRRRSGCRVGSESGCGIRPDGENETDYGTYIMKEEYRPAQQQ